MEDNRSTSDSASRGWILKIDARHECDLPDPLADGTHVIVSETPSWLTPPHRCKDAGCLVAKPGSVWRCECGLIYELNGDDSFARPKMRWTRLPFSESYPHSGRAS